MSAYGFNAKKLSDGLLLIWLPFKIARRGISFEDVTKRF